MLSIPPPVTQMKTEFERARRWRRARREPLQFGDVRWEALDRFLTLGFPTTQDVEWRHTDVAPIAEKIYALALPSANDANYLGLEPLRLPYDFATELVFVNGYYMAAASNFTSHPDGAYGGSLSGILDSDASNVTSYLARVATFERSAFVALNTALFGDGACILIPAHSALEKLIHVRFIATGEADVRPAMSNPRVLLVLGESSRATIVESYVGQEDVQYFTNAVTEVVLGDNSALEHYSLQCESKQAYHIRATNVIMAPGANYARHSINLGGALARDETVAVLGGERSKCTLNGLSVATGTQLMDNHTMIQAVMPSCQSQQVYNGILAHRAKGVFDGRIVVGVNAHQSDIKQTSRALLLSEDARLVSTKHLEKLANDVHCIQRCTTRRIDEQAALYVRSSGVGDAEARRLTKLGLIQNVMKRLSLQPLAVGVEELIQQQLEGGHQ